MQDRPICAKCIEKIEANPYYESYCGHDQCPSAVWHGWCLMEFREEREQATGGRFTVVGLLMRPLFQEHTEHG